MSELIQTRRGFLKSVSLAGGGLALGFHLTSCATEQVKLLPNGDFKPNAFLQLNAANKIIFHMPRAEMGQGILTGLTTIVAEELDVDPAEIDVQLAGVGEVYDNPEYKMQVTGGSSSVRTHFVPLRESAATMRAMLLTAASQQLAVAEEALTTQNGMIIADGQRYPFSQFAVEAGALSLPKTVELKRSEQFRYIGKKHVRLDGTAKVTGTAEFGIDVDFPGLYRAALKRCEVIGGKVKRYDANAALQAKGVKTVVEIFNGVAVVADTYWQAKQALALVSIEWDLPKLARINSDEVRTTFHQALATEAGKRHSSQGDVSKALASAATTVEAEYEAPYLAHATMEPMNCTVKIANGRCDVWLPTQAPDIAQGLVAFQTGIDKRDILVHSTLIGGGFGRRAYQDYVVEAVAIAQAAEVPVQLIWSREDDMQNGFYRPASMARFQAGLDERDKLQAWSVTAVGPNLLPYMVDQVLDSVAPQFLPNGLVDWASKRGFNLVGSIFLDEASVEGLSEDYDAANKEMRHITIDPGLPVGYWRSVGHSSAGFFKESFMDEVAYAAGKDPLQMRLDHTSGNPRLNEVIKAVAELVDWQNPPEGRSYGIAAHESFHSYVAEIAEVSVLNNRISVHKVYCAVDCGLAINPDVVKTQMEGGIIFGMTAALYGEITLQNGAVQQSNFHDYQMLRMQEAPVIETVIITSNEAPTGVGEISVPPIAAAIANGVFAATGQRLRRLPLKPV